MRPVYQQGTPRFAFPPLRWLLSRDLLSHGMACPGGEDVGTAPGTGAAVAAL